MNLFDQRRPEGGKHCGRQDDQRQGFDEWFQTHCHRFHQHHRFEMGGSGMRLLLAELDEPFSGDARTDFCIQLVTRGGGKLGRLDMGFGRASGTFGAGGWISVPCGAPLNLDGQGGFELLTLSVPWASIDREVERMVGRAVGDFGPVHTGGLKSDRYVAVAMKTLYQNRNESELYADSMMTMILARLAELSKRGPRQLAADPKGLSEQQLAQVVAKLHAVAEAPFDGAAFGLDSMAGDLGQSKFQFLRNFKKATGITPYGYLTRLRVEMGRLRLNSGMPPLLAGISSGFYDQSHFTRHFKRVMGVTPGRYQRAAT